MTLARATEAKLRTAVEQHWIASDASDEQSHLQVDATVSQRDLVSLAIRLETLIIVSNGEALRPPREVALALATYVWSLGDGLPIIAPALDAIGRRNTRARPSRSN